MATATRGRVLLVEPDAHELGRHTRLLGQAGFDVESARSSADAQSMFKRGRFDAVLSDASATKSAVEDLVRAIRQVDDTVSVILLGGAHGSTHRFGFRQGAVEHLAKPIAPSALEHALERAVSHCRKWRSLGTYRNRRGEETEVASFTATDAKNEFGRVLQKANRGIVVITRHDEPEAVLLSFDEFRDLATARERKLEALTSEFDQLLARMQTPEARKGIREAFDATPDRMGEAAVEAARRRG